MIRTFQKYQDYPIVGYKQSGKYHWLYQDKSTSNTSRKLLADCGIQDIRIALTLPASYTDSAGTVHNTWDRPIYCILSSIVNSEAEFSCVLSVQQDGGKLSLGSAGGVSLNIVVHKNTKDIFTTCRFGNNPSDCPPYCSFIDINNSFIKIKNFVTLESQQATQAQYQATQESQQSDQLIIDPACMLLSQTTPVLSFINHPVKCIADKVISDDLIKNDILISTTGFLNLQNGINTIVDKNNIQGTQSISSLPLAQYNTWLSKISQTKSTDTNCFKIQYVWSDLPSFVQYLPTQVNLNNPFVNNIIQERLKRSLLGVSDINRMTGDSSGTIQVLDRTASGKIVSVSKLVDKLDPKYPQCPKWLRSAFYYLIQSVDKNPTAYDTVLSDQPIKLYSYSSTLEETDASTPSAAQLETSIQDNTESTSSNLDGLYNYQLLKIAMPQQNLKLRSKWNEKKT